MISLGNGHVLGLQDYKMKIIWYLAIVSNYVTLPVLYFCATRLIR